MAEKQLPLQFIKRIETLFPNDYSAFLEALLTPPATSIRLKNGVDTSNNDIVPWCKQGRYLIND